MAPVGLMLCGLGLSLTGEAIILKGAESPFWHWFVLGTSGLVVFNSGLSVFGDAVKRRLWYDMRRTHTEGDARR